MICWTHLCRWEGRTCGCSEGKNVAARADFFKKLVAAESGRGVVPRQYGEPGNVDIAESRATATLRRIESSVEAGELFGEASS